MSIFTFRLALKELSSIDKSFDLVHKSSKKSFTPEVDREADLINSHYAYYCSGDNRKRFWYR